MQWRMIMFDILQSSFYNQLRRALHKCTPGHRLQLWLLQDEVRLDAPPIDQIALEDGLEECWSQSHIEVYNWRMKMFKECWRRFKKFQEVEECWRCSVGSVPQGTQTCAGGACTCHSKHPQAFFEFVSDAGGIYHSRILPALCCCLRLRSNVWPLERVSLKDKHQATHSN